MSKRVEKALEYHKKNYNCCQAVACAFCDLVGLEEETMFGLTEGFGLGMGCMDGTCGAVSGAVALAGLKNSSKNLNHPDSKQRTYQITKQIVEAFEKKNHSIVCKELKGTETNQVLRSCTGCIEDAARLAEQILFSEEK